MNDRRLFVKICGITSEDDALLAAAMGADAIGMIFAASSSRITKGRARDIVRRLPPEVLSVGVFRNESRERVVALANDVGLRAVQLHGHESAEDTRWVAERVPNVIRAFGIGDPALARIDDYGDIRLLIDAPEPGSGKTFDWNALAAEPPERGYILAGGLDPENVERAIRATSPWGVDVKSGVEAKPGTKDPMKVKEFIATARATALAIAVQEPAGDLSPYNWAEDAL